MFATHAGNRKSGFTLVEALLSLVIVGVAASIMSALYISGTQALDVQARRVLIDSGLRGKMEWLVSLRFSQLVNGSGSVTVNGQACPIAWTAQNVDLDGDGTAEPSAKQVSVTIEGRTLTTIIVNNEGKVGNVS